MEMLSISHIGDQYPGTLSGGESQRTAWQEPWPWLPGSLLDEPFSALDLNTAAIPVSGAAPDSPAFWLHHHLRHPRFSEARTLAGRAYLWMGLQTAIHRPADGRFSAEMERFLEEIKS